MVGYGGPAGENPYVAPKGDLGQDPEFLAIGPAGPARVRIGAIGEAWNLLSQNLGTWVLLSFLFLICNFGLNLVTQIGLQVFIGVVASSMGPGPATAALVVVAFLAQFALNLAVNAFIFGGMFRAACRQARGRVVDAGDLFRAGAAVLPLIVASLVFGLAVVGVMVAVVLPVVLLQGQDVQGPLTAVLILVGMLLALMVAGRLMFTFPLIVDGGLGGIEAIRRSWQALRGQTFMAALVTVLAGLVSGLGVILCFVGVLFTLPLYYLTIAVLYRDFFAKSTPWVGAPDLPPAPPGLA
ncbi:MAG TPA: glycerophosphoryl diester phosphodiesterase membrane domain-containing protein [Isosphaeraceae bacterium]